MEQYRVMDDLNKTSLAEAVAARTGLSLDDAYAAVHATLDTVAKALVDGYSVSVTNFGSWHPAITPTRPARNPQTGEAVQVPERFRVKWTSAPKLRAMINGDAPADITKDPSH
jgi:DNA-binding protein HU-beta